MSVTLYQFAADLLAKYDQAVKDSIPEARDGSHKKALASHKGRVTKLTKQLQAFEQPAVPGLAEGMYKVLIRFDDPTAPGEPRVYLTAPGGENVDNVTAEVHGFLTPISSPLPTGPAPASETPPDVLAANIQRLKDTVLGDQPPVRTGPHDLVVAVDGADKKVVDKTVAALKRKLGVNPSNYGTEAGVVRVWFRYPSLERATDAAALAAAVPHVRGADVQPADDGPVGPAAEPIELEVTADVSPGGPLAILSATDPRGAAVALLAEALGAHPIAEPAAAAEPGRDVLIYGLPTIKAAYAAADVARKVRGVVDTFVGDPYEDRFSDEELDRLDAAPRALAQYATAALTAPRAYCTRCAALGHVEGGYTAIMAGVAAGADCWFCGWKPKA